MAYAHRSSIEPDEFGCYFEFIPMSLIIWHLGKQDELLDLVIYLMQEYKLSAPGDYIRAPKELKVRPYEDPLRILWAELVVMCGDYSSNPFNGHLYVPYEDDYNPGIEAALFELCRNVDLDFDKDDFTKMTTSFHAPS